MRRPKRSASSGMVMFAAFAISLAGCSPDTPSTQPADSPSPDLALARALDAEAHPSEALFRELAEDVPGFAGIWYDAHSNEYQLSGRDMAALANKSAAVHARLDRAYPHMRGTNLRQRPAKYTYTELANWRQEAGATVLSDEGVIGLDLDEKDNLLAIAVLTEASRGNVRKLLSRTSVPLDAVRIQVEAPMFPQVQLTDNRRPRIENGFMISFVNSGSTIRCTHGADAIGNGGFRGFLTASHCSVGLTVGSLAATLYYQANPGTVTSIIGGEKYDRALFTGGPCPIGKQCRYSDAVFVDYNTDERFANRRIAETTVIGSGTTSGSLTVASIRPATQSANVLNGFVIRKTGRATGTTQGSVVKTCTDVPWKAGSPIWLLCQDEAAVPSLEGDSGSPVYFEFSYPTPTSAVYHVGILWAGNCNGCVGNRMWFSPWVGIATDLPVWYPQP